MSVVHVNSISGITSITTPSSSDVLTIHKSNNAERLRIDSSGRLLLGTTTEGFATYGDKFTIADSGHCGMTIRSGDTSDGNIYFSDGTSGADEVRGFVEYNHNGNTMNLGTNGGWKLRIDSNGHVGLGIAPSDVDSIGKALNIASSTGGAIYLQDTDAPTTKFAAISYNGVSAALQIHAHHGASTISLGTDGTERLHIDSSGNIRQTKTGANVNFTLSRNESVTSTNTAIGVVDFACNTAHTVQARLMGKTLGTSNVGGDLVVETRANGGSLDERVRFTGEGEVLIGRSAWGSNLHPNDINRLVVVGTSPADSYDSQCHLEGSETSGAANTGGALAFAGHDGSSFRNWGNIYGMKENGSGGNTASYMAFHTRAAGGSPAEKMRITSSGSVGIGTDDPDVDNRPGLHLYTTHTDSCRLNFETPTKPNSRMGYFGLNRFGIDAHAGFEIRDCNDSYETRFQITSAGAVRLYHNGNSVKFATTSWGAQPHGDVIPHGDNTRTLGWSNERWTQLYAASGSINTSDRTEKNTIVDSDLGLSFINKLKPVSYKFNSGVRTHYGLIAQDIEDVLPGIGKTTGDFAAFIKTDNPAVLYEESEDTPEGKEVGDVRIPAKITYGLRYSEFIAPLIKAVQELSDKVDALESS